VGRGVGVGRGEGVGVGMGRGEGEGVGVGVGMGEPPIHPHLPPETEFFIDNLLVRIHFIIVMIRWTGLAPWEFEFPFPGSQS